MSREDSEVLKSSSAERKAWRRANRPWLDVLFDILVDRRMLPSALKRRGVSAESMREWISGANIAATADELGVHDKTVRKIKAQMTAVCGEPNE